MPSDSKNLKADDKHKALSALTANPSKTKDIGAVYQELNTQTNNTTETDKQRIDRAQIG